MTKEADMTEWREHGPSKLSEEERYHSDLADRAEAVAAITERIADPNDPLSADETDGDVIKDGRHVLRAGKIVIVFGPSGPEDVTEHKSEAKARAAFRAEKP